VGEKSKIHEFGQYIRGYLEGTAPRQTSIIFDYLLSSVKKERLRDHRYEYSHLHLLHTHCAVTYS
jgi:hypothetical protein